MNMEVADQWRREWAGRAEFGKVTEGGVTRRIARAMEVLHASGPGARVRVMRAAYHSTSGPGAPEESFMLHSSRRVISSGFNYLDPPSLHLPTKPLEISSTPLEPYESNGEIENYKVTEPDDLEISEPSKWKSSTRGTSIRMPSEESSSTDNASIIDLDPKTRNLHRKYSYDSESSDVQLRSRSNSNTSQCLDVPVTLSTLKYKSLLNNSNEWNTRRKSYSFEDTSPPNESISHNNETLAMESSTDSGICKSTEIMNDFYKDDNIHTYNKEESFKDWLSKNRQNSQYRGTKFKTYREHEIVLEDPKENNITLQSHGRVSITLPVTVEADSDNNNNSRNNQTTDDIERRVKKVEFCKTELHFAAESGKVNIIATDEKPPPSNDFRKRRSAFVPMQDIIDRPITLFGEEKNEVQVPERIGKTFTSNGDFVESDEYTAATKSILKNKIPKPKPYLLGENMEFGLLCDVSNKNINDSVSTTISMVNKQLESEKNYKGHTKSLFSDDEKNVMNGNIFRTINAGPFKQVNLKYEKPVETNIKIEKESSFGDVKNKVNSLNISPVPGKSKTRQLRESDLTYFGISNPTHKDEKKIIENGYQSENVVENIFQSVKLIQRVSNSVSNSVCNSEPESDDAPEYQNLPINMHFAPVPTPRSRSKYDNSEVTTALTPITEKDISEAKNDLQPYTRRTKSRGYDDVKPSRSLSEPPKNFKHISKQKSTRRDDQVSSSRKQQVMDDTYRKSKQAIKERVVQKEDSPVYVNLNINVEMKQDNNKKLNETSPSVKSRNIRSKDKMLVDKLLSASSPIHDKKAHHRSDSGMSSNRYSVEKDTLSTSLKREGKLIHSDRDSKLHYSRDKKMNDSNNVSKSGINDKRKNAEVNNQKNEHNSREMQKSLLKNVPEEYIHSSRHNSNRDGSTHRHRNASTDKQKSTRENRKLSPKRRLDSSVDNSSVHTKTIEKDKDFSWKSNNHKGKHREYIINYDDKNGTVSSICKRTTEIGSPRRKISSKDKLKENHETKPVKTKTIHKIALSK